eukprot:TRINITY_DN5482_c0_g1_i1.p1 TRINITY_DN5482_c0_g1~~TRINITY_DN5482_c0_g1_i1.p1  ORF type:complete len:449 (-),score=50.58 TRINITY_DN5482_c0_g1_i1:402-1748(-)
MIYTTVDNFYLTEDQLLSSPSRQDGISFEDEQQLRMYACDLIQEVGILLLCPQQVLATAQVLLHRFYCKKSFKNYMVKHVAMGCLLLGSKLEEVHQDIRDICLVVHRVLSLRESITESSLLDLHSSKYVQLKSNIIKAERHILKNLQFIMHVDHPHKFTLTLLNVLFLKNTQEALMQEAWNLANDSLRSTLCVRYKSNVVACGIIYLAARRYGVYLPDELEWWTLVGAQYADVMKVVDTLEELYTLKKPAYVAVYHGEKGKEEEDKVDKSDNSSTSQSRSEGDVGDKQEKDTTDTNDAQQSQSDQKVTSGDEPQYRKKTDDVDMDTEYSDKERSKRPRLYGNTMKGEVEKGEIGQMGYGRQSRNPDDDVSRPGSTEDRRTREPRDWEYEERERFDRSRDKWRYDSRRGGVMRDSRHKRSRHRSRDRDRNKEKSRDKDRERGFKDKKYY